MRRSRIEIAAPHIAEFIKGLDHKVFLYRQLEQIVSDHRQDWKLASSMSMSEFVKLFVANGTLRKVDLEFSFKPVTRYICGNASVFELANSIRPHGYLSHRSAFHIHKLTQDAISIIYINDEQDKDNSGNKYPTQEKIDAAFKRKMRISHNRADFDGIPLCIINGMNTGRHDVKTISIDGIPVEVTSVERTLIDAAVRPGYCGGVNEVAEAYKRANGKFSLLSLADLYKSLKYSYPYHQSIGFYLDMAKIYSPGFLDIFEKIPRQVDFYLEHNMGETKYSKKWRIYYPAYMQGPE